MKMLTAILLFQLSLPALAEVESAIMSTTCRSESGPVNHLEVNLILRAEVVDQKSESDSGLLLKVVKMHNVEPYANFHYLTQSVAGGSNLGSSIHYNTAYKRERDNAVISKARLAVEYPYSLDDVSIEKQTGIYSLEIEGKNQDGVAFTQKFSSNQCPNLASMWAAEPNK